MNTWQILPHCLCCTVTWQHNSNANRHLAKPHFKVDGWQVIWSRDSPSSRGVVAARDLTNRAKDMFNTAPRRHHLSWCNFRPTKGRNTRKLGRMVMAWKQQQRVDCSFIFWNISFWRKQNKQTLGSCPGMK